MVTTSHYPIIIVGGGFAGINFIKHFKDKNRQILLLDKVNYHQFQPLFYQVASSRLESSSIVFPLRKFINKYKNVSYRLAEVQFIDNANKIVKTNIGDFSYEQLIIATGCTTNYYGNAEIEANALPMKSMAEALTIRNNILLNFEKAIRLSDDEKKAFLNIVIVGGGATGVELAGAFSEFKKYILPKDFPEYDFSETKIILIEGGKSVLSAMSPEAQKKSLEFLEELGVQVILQTVVTSYDGTNAVLSNGQIIPTKNLIWAAGINGNYIQGIHETAKIGANRIKVNRYFEIEGMKDVYAMGDIACMMTEKYPKGHPQVATVANAQAKHLAKNFNQQFQNVQEFEYEDKGSMATVGKRRAVVDLKFIKFSGLIAWLFWMFLHLMLILSVRNKMIIFINWMVNYFTNNPSLRLIMNTTRKDKSKEYFE